MLLMSCNSTERKALKFGFVIIIEYIFSVSAVICVISLRSNSTCREILCKGFLSLQCELSRSVLYQMDLYQMCCTNQNHCGPPTSCSCWQTFLLRNQARLHGDTLVSGHSVPQLGFTIFPQRTPSVRNRYLPSQG